MTWREIAEEQRNAASVLVQKKRGAFPRASCSRAYYAVYAHLADKAPESMAFPNGWKNPSHDQILSIIDQLSGIPKVKVRQAVRRLRLGRVLADYGVGQQVTRADAIMRLRDCEIVFREV